MKKHLIILMLLLLATVGCQKAELGNGTFEDGLTMEMSFATDPSSTDTELVNAIANMRIFLFDSADKKLKYVITNIKKKDGVKNTVVFELPLGTWNIFGISNLESKKIDFAMEFGKTKEQLLHTFAYSATGNGVVASTADKGANCSEIVSFSILDKEIKESASSTNLGTLSFKRMVGKVTLAIVDYLGSVKPSGKHEVEIIGVPTKLSFDGSLLTSKLEPSRLAPQMMTTSEKMIRKMTINTSEPTKNKSTFIIPAWYNYDGGVDGKGNNKFGIRIKLEKIDGTFFSSTLAADTMPYGLAANRELYVAITANADIEVENTVLPWTPEDIDGDIGGSQLTAPSEVMMVEDQLGGSFSTGDISVIGRHEILLAVKNSNAGTYQNVTYGTSGTAELPNTPSWLTKASFTVVSKKSLKFNFTYKVNATSNKEPYYIKIKSGNITRIMKVIYGDIEVLGTLTQIASVGGYWTYVGAFWRASQKGERFIRIANPNTILNTNINWTAQVVPCGWSSEIVLQNYSGALRGEITPAESYNADTPLLSGGSQKIYGTGDINFRIGLKSTIATNDNPRYALVIIQYENNTKYQYLYLRQGEEPDYLMRPQDNNLKGDITDLWGGTSLQPRPLAKKWAVYNLTTPTLKNGSATGGTSATNNTQHPKVEVNGAVFVDYPTQAGAFWQHMVATPKVGSFARRAYHPTKPTGVISGWNANDNFTEYWEISGANQEVSPILPVSFRRPTDGPLNYASDVGAISGSEMRQSLWINPFPKVGSNPDNSVFGYYADGFFDRRNIVDAVSNATVAKSTVVFSTNYVAYVCRLFFNKFSKASVSFPASGSRSNTNGALYRAGYYGSSSASHSDKGWYLHVASGNATQTSSLRGFAFALRPVVVQ